VARFRVDTYDHREVDGFMKRALRIALSLVLVSVAALVGINIYVLAATAPFIFDEAKDVPRAYAVLVPGAFAYRDGRLSHVLYDRVQRAQDLYRAGTVKRFLLSGDHGRKTYNEVNIMKSHLMKRGVPGADIFTDHAGFITYDSIVRAKRVFQVRDMVVVTQRYHLPRAVYIARTNGIDAYGLAADRRTYRAILWYRVREFVAVGKAFVWLLIDKRPRFLGTPIPITGDSAKSWD